MIGIRKVISGTVAGTTPQIFKPSDEKKEYVLMSMSVWCGGAQNYTMTLTDGAGSVTGIVVAAAPATYKNLADFFLELVASKDYQILNKDIWMTIVGDAINNVITNLLVVERPINTELALFEWNAKRYQQMPPGFNDLVNLQLGYRSQKDLL